MLVEHRGKHEHSAPSGEFHRCIANLIQGLANRGIAGNREEHTAKTSYTTFIEVLQKVVVFEFQVIRDDSEGETRVGEVYGDASYLGRDDGNIRIWDGLLKSRELKRRETKTEKTDRDFRHNGVLFKHSQEDFIEILSIHVLGSDNEGVNICARSVYTKSIRSICIYLPSSLLGCFGAQIVFQAGFLHELADKIREMTEHLFAVIGMENGREGREKDVRWTLTVGWRGGGVLLLTEPALLSQTQKFLEPLVRA